jgi:hypothetical protein
MRKATRDLIKARQPYTQYVLEVVAVHQQRSCVANACFKNATADSLLEQGNKVVSGWMVGRFIDSTRSTEIIQHWWNIDIDGNYFDLTDGVSSDAEYVVDSGIAEYGQMMLDSLESLVAMSLLYQDGKFFGVREVDGVLTYKKLIDLSDGSIFGF